MIVFVSLCLYFMRCCAYCTVIFFFFFKQKTAYEMRISDWSSDVCSSDLGLSRALGAAGRVLRGLGAAVLLHPRQRGAGRQRGGADGDLRGGREIGRASCRERVCQYV